MRSNHSEQIKETTDLIKAFKNYSEGAKDKPLPYIKATIILGVVIILIFLTLAICNGNPSYFQIIFFVFFQLFFSDITYSVFHILI